MHMRITLIVAVLALVVVGCVPELQHHAPDRTITSAYGTATDTVSIAELSWREYFRDSQLVALIDAALQKNQERGIVAEEVAIAANEVMARRGEVLPTVDVRAGAGAEKSARTTRDGAVEESLEIVPGRTHNAVPLGDVAVGAAMVWEVDIWRKLRNAADAAQLRRLASQEGYHLITTTVVADVAEGYYELLALDEQLRVIDTTIALLQEALHILELQKQSAKATELAVQRFRAEVLKAQARRFTIRQQIAVTEGRLNTLAGRGPRVIERSRDGFARWTMDSLRLGRPNALAVARPDVRRVELELAAAGLDVEVQRASFYPSLGVRAGGGLRASDATLLASTPESIAYSALADLVMPVINRTAIESRYGIANARLSQAAYAYEQTLARAHNEVVVAIAAIDNARAAHDVLSNQVAALVQSVGIAGKLYQAARADYMEVLLTQRDAMEAKMDLIEVQLQQMRASVTLYRALGGGWR